jgi:hypothetical protein
MIEMRYQSTRWLKVSGHQQGNVLAGPSGQDRLATLHWRFVDYVA